MADLNKFLNQPERVEKAISRMEIAALLATLAGVVMLFRRTPYSGEALSLGLSALTLVYILSGIFWMMNGAKKNISFPAAMLLSYFSLALTTLGILSMVMRLPLAAWMISAGCIAASCMFLFFIYKLFFTETTDEAGRVIINNLIVRMLPALLLAGFLAAFYLRN